MKHLCQHKHRWGISAVGGLCVYCAGTFALLHGVVLLEDLVKFFFYSYSNMYWAAANK